MGIWGRGSPKKREKGKKGQEGSLAPEWGSSMNTGTVRGAGQSRLSQHTHSYSQQLDILVERQTLTRSGDGKCIERGLGRARVGEFDINAGEAS